MCIDSMSVIFHFKKNGLDLKMWVEVRVSQTDDPCIRETTLCLLNYVLFMHVCLCINTEPSFTISIRPWTFVYLNLYSVKIYLKEPKEKFK